MKKKFDQAWKKMRATHLLTYPECRACGTHDNVVVHHLRYRGPRGHSELPGDLMTLCATHHDEFHRLHQRRDLIANSLRYVEWVAQQQLIKNEAMLGIYSEDSYDSLRFG